MDRKGNLLKCFYPILFLCTYLQADTEFTIAQGYRRDRLSWSVSGPDGHPNIISKLTYKHLDVYTTTLSILHRHEDYFALAKVGYGNLYDGTSRDSDYRSDNRHDEFSRSREHVTGDYTFDAVLRLGKEFALQKSFKVSPFIGYGYYVQKVRVKHGVLIHDEERWPHEKIHGLNTTFKAKWFGPQIGAQLEKTLSQKISLFAAYTFIYPLSFEGTGNWNLRNLKFTQEGKSSRSHGQLGLLGTRYQLTRNWQLKGEYERMLFTAKGGHHNRINPFRKAERRSWEVRLALDYSL